MQQFQSLIDLKSLPGEKNVYSIGPIYLTNKRLISVLPYRNCPETKIALLKDVDSVKIAFKKLSSFWLFLGIIGLIADLLLAFTYRNELFYYREMLWLAAALIVVFITSLVVVILFFTVRFKILTFTLNGYPYLSLNLETYKGQDVLHIDTFIYHFFAQKEQLQAGSSDTINEESENSHEKKYEFSR